MKYLKKALFAAISCMLVFTLLDSLLSSQNTIRPIHFIVSKSNLDDKLESTSMSASENDTSLKKYHAIDYIPILMYHNITTDPLETNKITVSKDRFSRDIKYIKKNGYTPISFKDLINFKEGKNKLPPKPIIITFDDGKKSVYDLAYPILKKNNFKFTFFVIGKRLEQLSEDKKFGKYIKWSQAKEMYDSGLAEIQPHTYDMHFAKESLTRGVGVLPLAGETEENHYNRFKDDTEKIVKAIKEKVGSDSYVYSYPYGKHNETNEKVLSDMGFSVSTVTNTHYTDISGDLWNLKRINVPCQIELEELLQRVKQIRT